MQNNRTKQKLPLPFFLGVGGFLVLGGCSVFGAGEPIQEIDDAEAHAFEEGFLYISRESDEETKFVEQLESAFEDSSEEGFVFKIYDYVEYKDARISDFGLNNNRNSLAYYSDGELQDEINLKDLNKEADPEVIHRALVDFIEFNKSNK